MTPPPPAPARRPVDPLTGAVDVVVVGLILVTFNLAWGRLVPRPVVGSHWHWGVAAALAGFVLPLCYWTGYRIVGLIPPALSVLLGVTAAGFLWDLPPGVGVLVPAAVGVAFGALLRFAVRRWPPARDEHTAGPVAPRADAVIAAVLRAAVLAHVAAFLVAVVAFPPELLAGASAYGFFAYAAALTGYAWHRLFRPFFELCVEPVLWLGYRVRAAGPGLASAPHHGPLLVVANHACWWDPLFLAKVLPRPVTPVMTAKFYDIWFLRPLLAYTFQVIRVPEASVRREAPEIQDAIRALDEGKCVVIFPEGFLRRKEEVPLRRFGRGVWEILKARPDTPVLACWIEGAWGSWPSYYHGPPTKNKRPDLRRPIRVGVSEPVTVKPEVLAHHLQTRIALMNMVLAARAHLGLPPLPVVELPTKEDDPEPLA